MMSKEDRISRLPDDLLHKILSFLDAKIGVQTSVLSKRWKLIWTSLPFLNFGRYEYSSTPLSRFNFSLHILFNRNHQCNISELNLCIYPDSLAEKLVEYAISHNVECLNLDLKYDGIPYKLSTFSSNSLKKLTLRVKIEEESDCWDLPALTYLRLVSPFPVPPFSILHNLPESCLSLTSLPALRTLCLHGWDLLESDFSFSLPQLITLRLSWCSSFPEKTWNFPALLSLELDDVEFPTHTSYIFPTLVNLQNLTLSLTRCFMKRYYSISCPQLLNLDIRTRCSISRHFHIDVLAPKLCSFTSLGILSITFEAPELENVTIKLHSWFEDMDWIYRKMYYRHFTAMLSRLGNAKNLTFDLDSIEALSATGFLASLSSPFYNLKIVRLPLGYKETSLSSALRSYLLGGSPRATIVTTLPQKVNNQVVPVSPTSQKLMLDEPLATPTNVNSVVDTDRMRVVGAPGTSNDRASSFRENCDFVLW